LSPTPPSNSIIKAQSGDVVGYYTNSRDGNFLTRLIRNDGSIQLERDREYDQNVVWYKELENTGPLIALNSNNITELSVGAGGTLTASTNAAPMLRIITC